MFISNQIKIYKFQGTEEEAAEAYDIAAIKFRGLNAVTNFEISRYDVDSIVNSNLPITGSISAARASKASDQMPSCSSDQTTNNIKQNITMDGRDATTSSSLAFTALPAKPDMDYWSLLAFQNQQMQQENMTNQGLGLGLGFGVFSSGINLDFSNASTGCNNSCGAWSTSDGVTVQQQSDNNSSSCTYGSNVHASQVPFGSGSSTTAYEAAPFYYYHQAAFQTVPIFGME